jgi:methionine-S-sulfoxide reductase
MLTLPRLGRWLAPLALLAGLAAAHAQSASGKTETAIFAGGCFWCVEEAFEKVPGVLSAVSGYTGGTVANPTYEQVGTHRTGHAEAVEVIYDPAKVTYPQLVDWYWRNIDPFDGVGQFCDKGSPYRAVIFYRGEEQRKVAEETKEALRKKFNKPIATKIEAAGPFYPAEAYHQDYYKTSTFRYQYYKHGCGRPQRLEQIWGKPMPPPGAATN